jgi:hypothetical protein
MPFQIATGNKINMSTTNPDRNTIGNSGVISTFFESGHSLKSWGRRRSAIGFDLTARA